MSQMAEFLTALEEKRSAIADCSGKIVFMTGAGVSAESGIPTFRGKDGYWTVGSDVYKPEEVATQAMFRRKPEAVWAWYLYRLSVCRHAEPNPGHHALVRIEELIPRRFLLITQNVDGLHLRAGNSPQCTYQIHGNVSYMRCADACTRKVWPLPASLVQDGERGGRLEDGEAEQLKCPACGGWARPHVLWFDEAYDEDYYRFESSLIAAAGADMLFIIGTSGATTLPSYVAPAAAEAGAVLVDINIEDSAFTPLVEETGGLIHRGPSGEILPEIAELFDEYR